MKRSFFQNNIYTGLFFGIITPVIGFYLVQFIFEILVHFGLMQEVSGTAVDRRERTISLIAICTLLVPFQIFQKKRFMNVIKGILTMTFLAAAAWVFNFREGLFTF